MALSPLHQEVSTLLKELDARQITPPVEIVLGPYSFYPYRGFADISQRDDYQKLSPKHLGMLAKIARDILAIQRPELFEAFVNDDGTIVVDKEQENIEYSMDVDYNDSRSKVEEIYPQVSYPLSPEPRTVTTKFIRNDTAHEVTHHADFWIDVEAKDKPLCYLHSSSTLLALCGEVDGLLHQDGVAMLIDEVRTEEGYEAEQLAEHGYSDKRIDAMLRAEFFAIMGEFYFGTKQPFRKRSALLEAYVEYILELDLEIQNLYIPFMEMERKRAVLRKAIHQKVQAMLGDHLDELYAQRKKFEAAESQTQQTRIAKKIEKLVVDCIRTLSDEVRSKLKLPKKQ